MSYEVRVEQMLSSLLFSLYYSSDDYEPGKRSIVSDKIARSIARDKSAANKLRAMLNLLSEPKAPEPVSDEFLLGLLQVRNKALQEYYNNLPLYDSDGAINGSKIWLLAFEKLKAQFPEIDYNPHHYKNRPAFYGKGINVFSVNWAIAVVCIEQQLAENYDLSNLLADTQDDEGWVYRVS